jgi:hypothetical protein
VKVDLEGGGAIDRFSRISYQLHSCKMKFTLTVLFAYVDARLLSKETQWILGFSATARGDAWQINGSR